MRVLGVIAVGVMVWILSLSGAAAQDEDKDFLTRALQNALSGAGRTVSIDGFQGVLSAQASFDRMTIADDDGVWLLLEDVALDWNRSALLRGRLEVARLTAARLDLSRLPQGDPAPTLPAAEATPFRLPDLPDLPVSVDIADFAVNQITLGPTILGQATQMRVEAKAQLDDRGLRLDLSADRTDGQRGRFAVEVDLARQDETLAFLVSLSEGAGGLVAQNLALPGEPDVDLRLQAQGPLDDLSTDIALATDGQPRLTGQVALRAEPAGGIGGQPNRRVQANLGGDVTALFAPDYRQFFGPDVRLRLNALLESGGATRIEAFSVVADAVDLSGQLTLTPEGWPSLIDVTGRVANAKNTPVLLPLSGPGKTVRAVDLRVLFDAGAGDDLQARFGIAALAVPGAEIERLDLGLDGTLQVAPGQQSFAGDISFTSMGMAMTDAALAEALGTGITGQSSLRYRTGAPVEITGLELRGADYDLTGAAVIRDTAGRLHTTLQTRLTASDFSRFAALAGQEIDGQGALAITGEITPLDGLFDLEVSGETTDLRLGIAEADAVLAGRTELSAKARRDQTGTYLEDLVLENAAVSLTGAAQLRSVGSAATADFTLSDIALVLPGYSGPVAVTAKAMQGAAGWQVQGRSDGPYDVALTVGGLATGPAAALKFSADVPDVAAFAPQVTGAVQMAGTLRQSPQGWRVETTATGPFSTQANMAGLLSPLDVRLGLSLPDLASLVPQVSGPAEVAARLRQTQTGLAITAQATGPYQVQGDVAGQLTPAIVLSFDLGVPDLRPLVPQLPGAVQAIGDLRQTPDGFVIETTATGPFGFQASVAGLATGPDMRLQFDSSLPNVAPLIPGISGPLTTKGTVMPAPNGLSVETALTGPYQSRAQVAGTLTGPAVALRYDIDMPNLAAVVPGLNGPLAVDGTARQDGALWDVDTAVVGPSGTRATIAGRVDPAGPLDLDVSGTAPLGLSGPFIAPRSLQGQAQFDLAVNGPPALSSVTGTIRTSNARFSAPNLRLALDGVQADVQLARNRAALDVRGRATTGGQIAVQGGVTLTGALPADIQIALERLALIDPRLYATTVDGALRLAGPLTGGAALGGVLNIGETEISVPSTGLTSIGDIPAITHIGATRPVISTRRKAGLADTPATESAGSSGGGIGLDVQINAPNRIFVRGRGLDAELGGALQVTGSTNNILSAGRLDLLRGRLDILARRFELREGEIQFQGGLVPFIRFVSATSTQAGEARIIVEGPADQPEVLFEATPEAPQDEVLAQILFGRNIGDISAFQALQLANAVATLAGRGGAGVIANLREGFGLDDLDVSTSDTGETTVRAGKYISENVYSDVSASSDGSADVSLNIDLTPNLTGKATLGSDGDTGIGIFFEKDY